MRKFRTTYLPQYDMHVYYICCSRKQRIKTLKETFGQQPEEVEEFTNGNFEIWEKEITKGFLHQVCVLWVDSEVPSSATSNNVFVHELLHCVYWIMREKGLTLTDSSQEAYAYMIGYLYKALCEGKKKAQ